MKKAVISACIVMLTALTAVAISLFIHFSTNESEIHEMSSSKPTDTPDLSEALPSSPTEKTMPEQIILTRSGDSYKYDTSQRFMEENPHITIEFVDQTTTEQIMSAMLSKSDQVDVYLFFSVISKTYETLRDRGFCYPLESEILSETLDKMYPSIIQYATSGGTICGMPYNCQPQARIGINMDIWHALGMSDEEIPTTWAEFLTFLRDDWADLYCRNSDYALSTAEDNGRECIYSWILNDYNDLIHNSDQVNSYDTEEFRTVMEIFESIDFAALPNDSEARISECLFSNARMISPEDDNSNFTYLPLTFSKGAELTAPMGIHIAMINPYSRNKEAAMAYIEYLASNIDDISRHILFPGEYEIILNDELPETYESFAQELAAETDPEKIADLINSNPQYYKTTPRSIEAFRKHISGIHIVTAHTVNAADHEQLYDIKDRYFSGGMTLDHFISQMDRMLAMRAREDG